MPSVWDDMEQQNQAISFGDLTTRKLAHSQLVLDGVCSHCGHCGLRLTDSVSVQRGIGPACSKRGYHEDPVQGDEIQAFIVLADYPELISFLTQHYKPQGLRGLMNGLVRVASLNRKRPIHKDICDAIECLGFKNLASTLRKSLVSVFLRRSEKHPNAFAVRVLRREYSHSWNMDLKRDGYGVFYDNSEKSLIIPIHRLNDETELAVSPSGVPNKVLLWDSLVKYYSGLVMATSKGNFEIKESLTIDV